MKEELVQQLKNAGWKWEYPDDITQENPTLEELIEACGEGKLEIKRDCGNWYAGFWIRSEDGSGESRSPEKGKTPIEAVANLYLSLNKK